METRAAILALVGSTVLVHGQITPAPPPPAGSAAPSLPAASPVPTAPAPVPTTQSDNARYQAQPTLLDACQRELSAFNDKPCDLLFIGGSATAGWRGPGRGIWQSAYAPRHALNFSVDGDTTQNVLWRLNNLDLANLHPKVAVILIGQGNVDNSVHEIADGIKTVLVNTQLAFPDVKIILMGMVPNDREHDKMMQVNSIIRSYADNSSVFFVNLVPLMPEVNTTNPDGTVTTNYKGIGKDHVALDAAGYKIWADAMEPVLSKLLSSK